MKNYILVFLLSFVVLSSFAQKVDLDREYIKIRYTNLPTDPILDYEFRTFSVTANSQEIADVIKIYGFEKMEDEGTLNVDVRTEGVVIDNVEIKKREKVNKDKDGNVKSVDRYYKPVVSYHTTGSFSVQNSLGKPFTSNQGSKKVYRGNEYNSHAKASQFYKNNSGVLKDKFNAQFIKDMKSTVNKALNRKYGYAPYVDREVFWILDSKKNSEYEGHKKALADMKVLLGKITAEGSIEELKPEMQAVVAYFESVIPKFSDEKKKKHKKMRYASYYNIGKLYYYLDMPDKAIEYANKLIENDYDKGDGKKIIKEANLLKKRFADNKISTRHFKPRNVAMAEELLSEDDTWIDRIESRMLDAILINSKGERIDGSVEITAIKEDVKDSLNLKAEVFHNITFLTLGDNDEIINKMYHPSSNVSFIIDGDTYEAVKFDNKYGFVKVLYESAKISLYDSSYGLILKKKGNETGSLTSIRIWKIGFKKKLAKLVEDCPDLTEKVFAGSFKNDAASLMKFVKEYSENCK